MSSGPTPLPAPESVAGLVCDLDGVVYRGPLAVTHAVESLRSLSVPIVYATNNAGRRPQAVARHLGELGLDVAAEQVVTSAQAGAAAIAAAMPGARVLAVGGEGVAAALEEAGLEPTRRAAEAAVVMQGYGPHVSMSDLAEVTYAVRDGAWWVATNLDLTIPDERGIAPGNGALVAAVQLAVGRGPDRVCGKPHPDLYLLAAQRLGVPVQRTLAVGDRLDTDIEGANAAGAASILVLTGVHSRDDVTRAPSHQQPSAVIEDLRGLGGLIAMSIPRTLG